MLDNLPESAQELIARSQADVQSELPNTNPRAKNHWLLAIITAHANRMFDFIALLRIAFRQTFVSTATGDNILLHASERGLSLLAATQARGNVVITGVVGSSVPQGAILAGAGTSSYIAEQTVFIDGTGQALLPVSAVNFGQIGNLNANAQIRFQTPIVGIDDVATVDLNTIGGGSDAETLEDLRARNLDLQRNPIAMFNNAAIRRQAFLVAGVTRVFIQPITPAVGQVTVFFVRDNDASPIPSGVEVQAVKDSILKILPSHTDPNDVFVFAPTPAIVNFNFTNITPDTPAMREAIENNLQQFFDERTDVGINIDEDNYRSTIFNTLDVSGERLQTFSLSSPSDDILVDQGEIPTLGTVNF